MYRSRGLFLPLALIAVGVIILLANTGVLSQAALERLGDLWPLVLVIVGLQLILNHTMPRQQAVVVGLAATAVIVIAAVIYAALAPAAPFGTRQADSSQPAKGLTAATLNAAYSGAIVDLHAGDIGDALYRAHVEFPGNQDPPTFSLDRETGTLAIQQETRFSPFRPFAGGRRRLDITLSTRLPWTIEISGGVSNMRMDLRQLHLTKLAISGGVHGVDVQLPSPRGTVAVDISGGASNLTLRAPKGSEWNVSASGGVSRLTIDGSSAGRSDEIQRQSSHYGSASDRFDIEISGGASHIDFRIG